MSEPFRHSSQPPAPGRLPVRETGRYELYPSSRIPYGKIELGFQALAERLAGQGCIACDGYAGVLWQDFRRKLDESLRRHGLTASWIDLSRALKSEADLERMLAPFVGSDDPLFGRRCTRNLADFFDLERLAALQRAQGGALTIWYGPGAALAAPDAFLVYVDLPKNELQYRARAGAIANLGLRRPLPPKAAYRRSYFVDWPVLNAHKSELARRAGIVVDAQRPDEPALIAGDELRAALAALAVSSFRVRPWFEPGPWGGQWCARHVPDLPAAPNYAWSFELITPENGLLLRDGERLMEVSFDWLMYLHASEVLGRHAARFGQEFPLRFDFLDTVAGGNLSIQVHPSGEYVEREFGEVLGQDESYYILDAAPGARVHLGFQENIEPGEFRAALERSASRSAPLEVERWVQSHPARKHDLFLIPHGTIHGSGVGNLVLEISSTPYIFTFKLYDWLRPDLDGRPRPLNLERGMQSLDFSRAGSRVAAELVSRPRLLGRGADWSLEHLPTHRDQYYDVLRHRFASAVRASTDEGPQVLSLVEGTAVALQTPQGEARVFHYAETFVVPAAAQSLRLVNLGPSPAVVIAARLK